MCGSAPNYRALCQGAHAVSQWLNGAYYNVVDVGLSENRVSSSHYRLVVVERTKNMVKFFFSNVYFRMYICALITFKSLVAISIVPYIFL